MARQTEKQSKAGGFFQLITLSPNDGTDPVIAPMLLQCYDPLLVKVPQTPASETNTSEL